MKYSFFNFLFSKSCPVLLLLMSSILWPGSVNAKEIYFRPSISVKTEYDDNKRLLEDRINNVDKSAYGVIARANAKVGVRSDRYVVELDNQVSINRYISDVDLDSDDFKIDLSSNYDLSARSILGLSGNYTKNTSLTSEFDDEGAGTGNVQGNIIRRQWTISPHWNYSLSNRQNLQLSYSHSETTYDESERSSLVDYTVDFFSLSFKHQWTPLFSNILSASVMLYDAPEISMGQALFNLTRGLDTTEYFQSRDTTEYTVNIGAEYQIAPTWFAAAQVGVRFTNVETVQFVNTPIENSTSSDDQGLVFSVSTRKEFESGTAKVGFSRSTNAQGDGRLQVQNRFTGDFYHKLTERLSFSVNGSINDSSTSGNENDGNERTNYRVQSSIRWLFDKHASLSAGYTYRQRLTERDDEEAVSNAVFLTFNYRWDKFVTQKY